MVEQHEPQTTTQGGPAVSQKHILLSEILSVTSVMRKNSRWATSTSSTVGRDSALASSLGLRVSGPSASSHTTLRGGREKDLMAGFQVLKRTVGESEDIETLSLSSTLAPFLAVVRSPLSTGPITSAALSSLHNLFMCKYISPNSADLEVTLAELSSTVSNCKFEASDSAGDEAVMLKIMAVIEDCMCGSVGGLLGDVEVCEMLETVLTTCCQMRLSEILRRAAESTMHSIVRVMFIRLQSLDPSAEEDKLQKVKMSVVPDTAPPTDGASDVHSEKHADTMTAASVSEAPEPPVMGPRKRPEYGLPAVVELLRVLVNILDPNDKLHTDSTRLVSMRILNSALEVSGATIGDFPSLALLVSDHACKFLFQLARSDNPSVAQLALRTIATIFEALRKQLKLQQELFLAFTIDRLAVPQGLPVPTFNLGGRPGRSRSRARAPGSAAPSPRVGPGDGRFPSAPESPAPVKTTVLPAKGETRELLLDTLTQLSSHPSFMVDVYMNYDCDLNCEDLFGRLVEFLAQGVYPSPLAGAMEPQLQNAQYLSLEMLLTFVNHMAGRAEGRGVEEWQPNYPQPHQMTLNKSRKSLVTTGASLFNTKPKSGLAFLEEHGIIYGDLSPEVSRTLSLARFLKSCTRLDKRLLGDYISKPDNLDLLKEFVGLFDFRKKPVADGLREMLESFRLPGEAQQINRIAETFADKYFAAEPDEFKSQDAVYVVAYSVIMLNTDLHNPQVRKRMTIEDYRRNLRGVNEGSDFSPELVQNIYDSIKKREIVMPQEHTGSVGFEYAWKELLARSRLSGELMMCNSEAFDLDMFKATWTPVISAIAYAFMTFDDDYIIERAITGFRQCATLAGHFQLPDVFDYVVVTLSQTTSLLSEALPSQVPIYPIVNVDGHSITVSSLSVKFGTNVKGQLAAVVLFNIVNGNGNALREGWTQIFEMFQNLFLHSLLPTRMLQMEDFLGGVSMIPLRGSQPARPAPRQESGLLSALSSYLMTPYGSSTDTLVPDATDADVENTLSTIDCIAACRLDELYAQIIQLDTEALVAAVRAIEALAHERTVARLRQESDDPSATPHPIHVEPIGRPLAYDPASVFLLETMVSITCQTPQHIEDLWPIILEHLSALLSTPTQYSILLIERAVVALLRLCRLLSKEPTLRDQVYVSFDILARLPSSVSSSVAEQVIQGLLLIVQEHQEIIRSQTEWNIVFAVIRTTTGHPEAATTAFDMLAKLVIDTSENLVNQDNYQGVISVLDDFASIAGAAVEAQRATRRREPPLTSASSPVITRGIKAVELLYELRKQMNRFMAEATSSDQAWRQFCLPLLTPLARESSSASREVRHAALIQLQRIILGLQFELDEEYQPRIEELFNRVIFPLLDDLLKPQVFQRDPPGMPETRLRASALLCKTFMHLEVRESNAQADIRVLWIQILDLLDRLMNTDKKDQLYEAVPESLKNVILVMNATNILVPASANDTRNERQKSLWAATQERIERFLPGFLAEVLPAPHDQGQANAPASQAE